MRTLFSACAVCAALFAAQPAMARPQDSRLETLSSAQQTMYSFAVELFREHRYAAAYGRFARLADAGHAPSAQLALVMFRNGPTLFGSEWDATPEQVEHWSALLTAPGRNSL